MLIEWIFSDEFKRVYKILERLKKILDKSEKELWIDDFVELRRHFRKIQILFPKLLIIYNKELEEIKTFSSTVNKKELEKFSADLGNKLRNLENLINNAPPIIDKILEIRIIEQINEEKNKLIKIIKYINNLVNQAQRDSFNLIKLEKISKKEPKKEKEEIINKVHISGRLNNGWLLSNVQNVVNDLGGKIELTHHAGSHKYKIIFKGERPIPLSTTTPPFALVSEVSKITGADKRILIVSFSIGKLVTA